MDFEPIYKIERCGVTVALPEGCEGAVVRSLNAYGNHLLVLIADKDKKDALKKALEEVI